MVYRLIFSYRGTHYAGWQRQENALAIQQVAEEAFERLVGQPLRIIASSRTDSGVHARGQCAHVRLPRSFPERGLMHAINHRLPQDIRLMGVQRMDGAFHALACASHKEYRYRVSLAEVIAPIEGLFVAPWGYPIDFTLLGRATRLIVGRHDWSAFALSGGSHKQPFRTLSAAAWRRHGEELDFIVRGEGFLRGMVRSLVGTLLEVGSNRRSIESFERLLEGGERGASGPSMPAHGLVLEKVFFLPPWDVD